MRTQLGCVAMLALALQLPGSTTPHSHGKGEFMTLAAPAFTLPAPLICDLRSDEELLEEIVAGMRQRPKRISPMRLHDERAAALYDRLCGAPEYYLARAELALIDAYAQPIAARLGARVALIEFGAGTSLKARTLLDEMENPAAYVPVHVARTPLIAASRALAARFPDVSVLPVCADFTRAFVTPDAVQTIDRRVVYLSAATLAQLEPSVAVELLGMMHLLAGPQGAVLVGMDLEKEPATIERAYNDASGIAAELNRNVLLHLNHRYGADFDMRRYIHRAVWVEDESRMEMALVSDCAQAVNLGHARIDLEEGERMLTGLAHQYSTERFEQMAGEAGLGIRETWTDPRWRFSVQLLEPVGAEPVRTATAAPEAALLLPGRLGNAPAF